MFQETQIILQFLGSLHIQVRNPYPLWPDKHLQ